MQLSLSILSILATVGVVCAQVGVPPVNPPTPDSAVWVDYDGNTVIYNFGQCVHLNDPATGLAATEAAALQSVTCQLFSDNNCLVASGLPPVSIPRGVAAPNLFDVGDFAAQSAVCRPNGLP